MRTTFAFSVSAIALLLLVVPASAQEDTVSPHTIALTSIALQAEQPAAPAPAGQTPVSSAPQPDAPAHDSDDLLAQYFDNGTGGPQQGAGYFPDVPLPRDAPSNVIPADSGYREFSAGLLFSVVLGTGR